MRLVVACGLVLGLLLPVHGAPGPSSPQPSHRLIDVKGVVASLSRDGQTLTLRQDGGGTAIFRLVEGTLLQIAGGIRGLIPGMRVHLWAVAAGTGLPVVLRILPIAGIAPSRASSEAGAFQGIVLSQAGSTVTVLGENNAVFTVLITGTTEIAGAAPLARSAIVEVQGSLNSDGSVSARSIAVLFDPRRGTRVAGRITLLWPDVGFVLSDGTVVAMSEETWVLRGSALRPTGALAPGLSVTVFGAGKLPFVAARVVEISL